MAIPWPWVPMQRTAVPAALTPHAFCWQQCTNINGNPTDVVPSIGIGTINADADFLIDTPRFVGTQMRFGNLKIDMPTSDDARIAHQGAAQAQLMFTQAGEIQF